MAYKDLLVHLDDSEACAYRIEAAVALAKRHKAKVSGVALALESTISSYIGFSFPASLIKAQSDIVLASAESAVEKFTKMAADAEVECSSEIIQCSAPKAPVRLSYLARHADLSFMGQPNPDDAGAAFLESLLDGVLFASGRPVYVVPYIGRPKTTIRRAVVAWDGGKKVVRALNDAIPLLQGRGETVILVINPEQRQSVHGAHPGRNIAEHLEKHEVKARVEVQVVTEATPDNIMLNYLSDAGADLLIMGAYGHSKLREKAFGGVTNAIMHQMTAPVFMSE